MQRDVQLRRHGLAVAGMAFLACVGGQVPQADLDEMGGRGGTSQAGTNGQAGGASSMAPTGGIEGDPRAGGDGPSTSEPPGPEADGGAPDQPDPMSPDGGAAMPMPGEPPPPGARPLLFGGGSGARYASSPDGRTWKTFGSGAGGEVNDLVRGVGYGDGVFIAVGGAFGSGYVVRTTDGVTFTFPKANAGWLGDVAYDGGRWVAVGGNAVHTLSTDGGRTWRNTGISFSGHFRRLAAGGGLFVDASPDGKTWSKANRGGVPGGWEDRGVAYGQNTYVGVGGGAGFVGPRLDAMMRVGAPPMGDMVFGWVLPR